MQIYPEKLQEVLYHREAALPFTQVNRTRSDRLRSVRTPALVKAVKKRMRPKPCRKKILLVKQMDIVVGSLVVRAPDSRPEGLGSMSVPPNTLRVHTEYVLVKSVGPKVLWAESLVQGTGENFTSVPCLNCGGGER
ncbi:uncharacterized protein TNCV_2597901 [Trichonephila clavipes]|nr:uncharacterized protein TNCV_2597901 [Trichonephila clavipes]